VELSNQGQRIPTEADLKLYLKRWDRQYGMTYKVLDLLQTVFYRSDASREAFVEMCSDIDVQKLTFDSYLYKTVVPANPVVQLKITAKTLGSLIRGNALAPTRGW
jgi:geranylgeranyl reductase